MKIKEIRHIEDCFDGSFIKELWLSRPMEEDDILDLNEFGKLSYFKTWARPFYKLEIDKTLSVKGVEGNDTIRIVCYSSSAFDDFIIQMVQKDSNRDNI